LRSSGFGEDLFVIAYRRYRQIFGVFALGLWIASLALPVETDCGAASANLGYMILATGWLGLLGGLLGWYATHS
jgi:hypothetical protein